MVPADLTGNERMLWEISAIVDATYAFLDSAPVQVALWWSDQPVRVLTELDRQNARASQT